jgi:DNA-binding transcriptional MocR family regulator
VAESAFDVESICVLWAPAERGIAIASADMFCLEGATPNAVRLSLGGNLSDERLEHTLRIVAETLNSHPSSSAQNTNEFTARGH